MSRLLSSPRLRRRLTWLGLLATVGASAAVIGLFFSNTADKNESSFRKGRVQVVAPLPKSVKFTAREQHEVGVVAAQFVATAVLRTNTARSYDLTDRAFHQGLSRAEWGSGNIPVVPYPKEAVAVVKWRLDYSYKDRVGMKVSILPKPTATVGGQVFNIELHRVGAPSHRRWLVDYWTPAGLGSPAPASAAGKAEAPIPRPRAGLGAEWLFLPIALVFGAILLVPLILGIRGWRRNVRANRAYSTLSDP